MVVEKRAEEETKSMPHAPVEKSAGFRHYVHLVYSRTLEIWLINGWEEKTYLGTGVPLFRKGGAVVLL